ncbi:hypothetical protein HBH70_124880 [Parastagonospora nodorum]|nr:hypothetical protein HBH54_111840 [Parastagonospora nodorum]KAH4070178.1 hypothetical protein HBH50_095090 [Parastagonospora nodorum]KAH4090743.1 hypothetical protein HBH48_098860 [Parastagonospora nodorum]KAH4209647.1 hypothetical protein HBI95_078510 [Parastagonospora nodorum]KAH4260623.1 hypothetical protein HBI03_124600 [Parastagonospora nodorum]
MVSLNSDRTTSPTFFHTHLRWYQQPKNPPPALRSSWYQSMYFSRSVGCLSNACMPHSTLLNLSSLVQQRVLGRTMLSRKQFLQR